jgi:hypothetical protein
MWSRSQNPALSRRRRLRHTSATANPAVPVTINVMAEGSGAGLKICVAFERMIVCPAMAPAARL